MSLDTSYCLLVDIQSALRVVVACSSAVACRQVPQLLEDCHMLYVGDDHGFNYRLITKIEVGK